MGKIKINGNEYNVKRTVRTLFWFEAITGRSFKITSVLDNYILFYAAIMANNPDCKLTFDDLVDAVDADSTLADRLTEALDESPIEKVAEQEEEKDDEDLKEKKASASRK